MSVGIGPDIADERVCPLALIEDALFSLECSMAK